MSISPKFISLIKSKGGNAFIVSKEFLGEYYVYKLKINDETLRVRTNLNNNLNIGEECQLGFVNDGIFFLFPGAHKRSI